VHGLRLDDRAAAAMEDAINGIAGVVTVGLFAHRRADVLLVAGATGVTTITPAHGG
jgi:ribose 5-phosphate isomerase A